MADTTGRGLTNGDFGNGTCADWHCGRGWTLTANGAQHLPGASEALSQPLDVAAGTLYMVAVTESGPTTGTPRICDRFSVSGFLPNVSLGSLSVKPSMVRKFWCRAPQHNIPARSHIGSIRRTDVDGTGSEVLN